MTPAELAALQTGDHLANPETGKIRKVLGLWRSAADASSVRVSFVGFRGPWVTPNGWVKAPGSGSVWRYDTQERVFTRIGAR